jgi:hypothetical protein
MKRIILLIYLGSESLLEFVATILEKKNFVKEIIFNDFTSSGTTAKFILIYCTG